MVVTVEVSAVYPPQHRTSMQSGLNCAQAPNSEATIAGRMSLTQASVASAARYHNGFLSLLFHLY